MAFVSPLDQEGTPAPANPATGQAPVSSGGAGIGGAGKQSPSTPGQNVPAQPSAQLSAYLGANQPQAAAFGQNVAQTVGNTVNAAGQAILPAVNTYTGQQYTVPTDTATNTALQSSPSSLNASQQQSFENELGASSNAPNPAATFETSAPYSGLVSGIQNAVEQANLWNSGNNTANLNTALTTGGFEGPNATTGDTTLDSLLLSQTPGAYSQIQAATAPAANLQGQLASGAASADQALQNAIAADQAATPAAQQAAQTYSTDLTNYLNQQVAAAQSATNAINASNSSLATDLTSGNVTAADALAMGIPAAQDGSYATALNSLNPEISTYNNAVAGPADVYELPGQAGYDAPLPQVNLAQYLTPGAAAVTPNAANVASAQNYSDVAALQSLLAQANQSGLITPPINASTASQAGTDSAGTADSFNSTSAGKNLASLLALAESEVLPSPAGFKAPNNTDINAVIASLHQMGLV